MQKIERILLICTAVIVAVLMIQLLVFREPRSPFAKPEYTRLGDYEQRTDEAVEQILGRPARDRD